MSNLDILISGSGIAGSVFAFWLLHAYPDAKITIVERDASLRLTGASVDIRNSAVDIIRWMNVEQEIRDHCTNEEGMQVVDEAGLPIATLYATRNTNVQSFTSEYEIFRGALAEIFIEKIKSKAKFIFDESVDQFEQIGKKVIVTFANSRVTKSYDLLVGADGFNSGIRGMMLSDEPRDIVYDEGVHIAYFTVKSDLLRGSRLAKGYNVPGGRAVYLRPDPSPDGRTRVVLMNVTTTRNTAMKSRLNKALQEGNESFMSLMEELFQDAGWMSSEVLQGMRESDDFYCSRVGQIRSPKLYGSRVVLVGDAGYATPGFGTSLAIVGGYLLAGELSSHGGDVDAALKRYEDLMLPFVQRSQAGGGAMQMFNPQTWWGIKTRNTLFTVVTWLKLDRLAMVLSSIIPFTGKKFPLPDYQWKVLQQVER